MSIFEAKTYESFLRNLISSRPKKGRGEVTRIAKALAVSTTLVSQILAGRKLFTPEQGQLLSDYFGLGKLERDFATFLLQRDRAGTKTLRDFWNGELDRTRMQSKTVANRVAIDHILSDSERATFYSNSLFSAIRLFTSTGERGQSLEAIAARFDLKRSDAQNMMSFLSQCGLCREERGRFLMGVQKTHLEEGSPHALRHHTNWRLRAIRQAETLSKDELIYTSPVSVSKADFEVLREKMVVFIGEFLETVHASPAEEVACFNLDFFWVKT